MSGSLITINGETPKASIRTVLSSINCSEQRRILLIGPSGAGKSTTLNILLNHNVTKESLKQPAAVCERFVVGGTTHEIHAYIVESYDTIIFDTIGLTDNCGTPQQMLDNLYSVFYKHNIGISCIILVIKKQYDVNIKHMLDIYESLFGSAEFYSRTLLVITHCEGTDEIINSKTFIAHQGVPEFATILHKFGDNIMIANWQTDENSIIDGQFLRRRAQSKERLMCMLARILPKVSKPMFFCTRNWQDFFTSLQNAIRSIFKLSETECKRLICGLQNQTTPTKECTDVPQIVHFVDCQCPICSKPVQFNTESKATGAVVVLECMHIYHIWCLLSQKPAICHFCKHYIIYKENDSPIGDIIHPLLNDSTRVDKK